MNKRVQLLPLFLIFLLVLLPFVSADLQDTLQQKADNLQEKADKAEDLANTFSDKESREQYLSNKWAEFINKTPLGKAITSTTATVKTADPLIKLIFGAEFNFNLNFLLIFSIWLIIFSSIRKRTIPYIANRVKRHSSFLIYGIIAFFITSLLSFFKAIPYIANSIVNLVNKIPSLFTQIFLLLLISFVAIWFAIRMSYIKEGENIQNENINRVGEAVEKAKEALMKAEKKVEDEVEELQNTTGLTEAKNLSLEEREKREADTLSGLEIARKLGESLNEETEDKVKKTVEKTRLNKTEKLNKTKKLNK